MKKFLCLAITIAMVLSFAVIPAYAGVADGVTAVIEIKNDTGKVDDFIDITYTIKGATTVGLWNAAFFYDSTQIKPYSVKYSTTFPEADYGFQYIADSITESVFDSTTVVGRDTVKWYQTYTVSCEDGKFSATASTALNPTDTKYARKAVDVSADGYSVFTAKFKRVGTGKINIRPVTYTDDKANYNYMSTVYETEGVEIPVTLDYDDPIGGTTADYTEASQISTIKFPADATEAAKDPSEWTTKDEPVKKVVAFAKASQDLLAGEYSIKIGNIEFKGIENVGLGKAWAIVVIDKDGDRINVSKNSDVTVWEKGVNITGNSTYSTSVSANLGE